MFKNVSVLEMVILIWSGFMDELIVIFNTLYHTYHKNLERFEKIIATADIKDETQQFEILYHSLEIKVRASKKDLNLFLECLSSETLHELSKQSKLPVDYIY